MNYIVCLLLLFSYVSAEEQKKQAPAVWFKAGPVQQPRYFLKGALLPLCGILGSVMGEPVAGNKEKNSKIEIGSCLQAKDDIEAIAPPMYMIMDFKDGLFIIQTADAGKKTYSIKADDMATLWALRFTQGDVALPDYEICSRMYQWRGTDQMPSDELLQERKAQALPFTTTEIGERIRFHVFEYHLGCGT